MAHQLSQHLRFRFKGIPFKSVMKRCYFLPLDSWPSFPTGGAYDDNTNELRCRCKLSF